MSHPFEEVALTVREVIHRVGFPCSAGTVMRVFHHTINNRVAEVHIRVGHIDFGAKHHSALFNLSTIHFLEKFETFFNRTVAVRAFHTRLGRSAFLLRDLFGALFVDICFTFLNQTDGEVP